MRTCRHRLTRESGFTLIELVVVLGIIAILATVAVATTQHSLPSIRLNQAARDVMLITQNARSRAVRTGRPYKICVYSSAATAFDAKGQGGYQLLACRFGNPCNDPTADSGACKNTAAGYDTSKVGAGKAWDVPSAVLPINGLGSPLQDVTKIISDRSVGFPNVTIDPNFIDSANATFTNTENTVEIEFTAYGTVDPNTSTKNTTNTLGAIRLNYSGDRVNTANNLTRIVVIDPAGGVRIQ